MKNILENVKEEVVLISFENIENRSNAEISKKDDLIFINFKDNYEGSLRLLFDLNKEFKDKIFINIGKNCNVTIVEEKVKGNSDCDNEFEIRLGENSILNYVEIQNLNDVVNNVQKNIYCGKNSYILRQLICLGSRVTKYDVDIHLEENSKVNDIELFFGDKEQKFELHTNLIHKGQNSNGNVIVKGVLKDKAYCNSHGILRINKEAQNTNTFLAEHVLLLSKDAKAHAIPALEIEANNVQAHHSASVTQIDNDKIFYLLSRGLKEEEAKKMIVDGFFRSALEKATYNVREEWSRLFEEKWK